MIAIICTPVAHLPVFFTVHGPPELLRERIGEDTPCVNGAQRHLHQDPAAAIPRQFIRPQSLELCSSINGLL